MTVCCLLSLAPPAALAQGVDLKGRPIRDVRIEGLNEVPAQLLWNQIQIEKGQPYQPGVVSEDIIRINALGRFSSVVPRVTPYEDGTVAVTYVVDEMPLLADVGFAGNKSISDQRLSAQVKLRAGDPADPFLINSAIKSIQRAYEEEGFFLSDVTIDQDLLDDSGILIFQVREGPKARLRGVKFDGNDSYEAKELRSRIRSKTYFFLLREGAVSREQLERDADRIRDFYRQRGYLDAQVGRRIEMSPNEKDAVVVFLISEGPRYSVASIEFEGNQLISAEQLKEQMDLTVGSIYSADLKEQSEQSLRTHYGNLGYIETRVEVNPIFRSDEPRVDLLVQVDEGISSIVGRVEVTGNELTQSRVVRRQVRGLTPGRPFVRSGLTETKQRLARSALFDDAEVTVRGEPDDEVRDVLIQVREKNTGTLSFGAGVSSDAGIIGAIDLTQQNFDITDYPESVGEFITGKAFRGAGQTFQLTLAPGGEFSRYGISWSEPSFLETPYFVGGGFNFREREREDWDERRVGGNFRIGQTFGDVWSASLFTRYEIVDVGGIDSTAPVDVFAVEGDNVVSEVGIGITRNTTNSRIFPTEGSIFNVGLAYVGALGGDFDFARATAEYTKFWSVDRDFFGRHTVLSMSIETGVIFEDNEAPVFERFYAGGHRSFRGFDFRGVGPRGIRNDNGQLGDDPIGGEWLFLLGFEYNFPVFQDVVRMVIFTDTGTVQDDIGFDQYRVSVGTGVRIKIPFLGQAPFAFDVAVPLVKEDGDEERFFSFDLAIPF